MTDAEIVLRLSQEQLNTVLSHLQVGRWCDVVETVSTIVRQSSPQLVNLAKIADASATAMEASVAQRKN